MEQSNGRPWEYRLASGDFGWGEPRQAISEQQVVPLPDFEKPLHVTWRWRGDGDDAWRWAFYHEFGEATCDFKVHIEPGPGISLEEQFHACALVSGHPSVWLLDPQEFHLSRNEARVVVVRGVSKCQSIGQILRAEGDFQCAGGRFKIINAGPSQNALLPVPEAIPGKLPFHGVWFIKAGRLSESEIAMLKQS